MYRERRLHREAKPQSDRGAERVVDGGNKLVAWHLVFNYDLSLVLLELILLMDALYSTNTAGESHNFFLCTPPTKATQS